MKESTAKPKTSKISTSTASQILQSLKFTLNHILEQMEENDITYLRAIECLDRLVAKIKPPTSTKMKSSIVTIYTEDDQQLFSRFSTQICLLHLDFDRSLKSNFLRAYDLQTLVLLLECELFYGFADNYKKVQTQEQINNLWSFNYLDGIIAFQFRNKQEGEAMQIKIKQRAPKMEQFREIQKREMEEQLKKKKDSSFLGKLKNKLFHQNEPIKEESKVLKVEKSKSITFDLKTNTICAENLPPQWEEILFNSGLKKQDLKDKEIAKIVIEETLIHQTKKEAERNPEAFSKTGFFAIEEAEIIDESPLESNQTIQKQLNESVDFLPPPPPPLDLPLPELSPVNVRATMKRSDLLNEIRTNNLKLRPVKNTEKGLELDASDMNKEQRLDLSETLRLKLQRRKAALNRREDSDDD